MALASAHRATFSVLALPLRAEYGLTMHQLGVLQSAVLAGYMLGQVRLSVRPGRQEYNLDWHCSISSKGQEAGLDQMTLELLR